MIAGVTGKIGRMLAERLCRTNRVIGLSTFSNRETRRWISRLPVHPICFDVTQDDVRSLPRDIDYVFFEFAFMHGAEEDPQRAWAVNVEGPARLAEYYRGVKGIVVGSTGSVYPPTRDGADEDTLPEPAGVYSLTRYAQEQQLRTIARRSQVPMIFLRYFHAYTETEGFVPRLARRIQSGQELSFDERHRNVIWQEDLVRCTVKAAAHCRCDPPVVNVCGPEKLSHRRLAGRIGKRLKKEVEFGSIATSPVSLLGRCEKMIRLFGPPQVDAEEGLRRVVEAIRSARKD